MSNENQRFSTRKMGLHPFELAPNVLVRALKKENLYVKYALKDEPTYEIAPRNDPSKLNVEIAIKFRDTFATMSTMQCQGYCDDLVSNYTASLLLVSKHVDPMPRISHLVFVAPIGGVLLTLDGTDFALDGTDFAKPQFTVDQKAGVAWNGMYDTLKKALDDRVLQTAINRTVLGTRQSYRNPNRSSLPNWDRLSDFVMAMESLFLTTEGQSSEQELSYRFAVNGASLLRNCCDLDVIKLHKLLKKLYSVRSKIVHGQSESKIEKEVDGFLNLFRSGQNKNVAAHENIMDISFAAESWLVSAFRYLASMKREDRQYNAENAWQYAMWGLSDPTQK